MGYDGTGTVNIPLEEFYKFVEQWAPVLSGTEWSVSPPRIQDGDLVMDIAYSTECHPSSWAVPPAWLKKEGK